MAELEKQHGGKMAEKAAKRAEENGVESTGSGKDGLERRRQGWRYTSGFDAVAVRLTPKSDRRGAEAAA